MALKRYWIGSLGPYFYDDTVDVADPDLIVTEKQSGLVSEGTIKALEAPVEDEDVVRLVDFVFFADIMYRNRLNRTVTADYTATLGDEIIWVDASAGMVTITLYPSATIAGREFIIEKIDTSANVVRIAGNGIETVNGDPYFDLLLQYESVNPRSTGSEYII